MKKKIISLLLVLAMVTAFSGCKSNTSSYNKESSTTEANTPVEGCDFNIASLKGPTSIGLVKLFSDSDAGSTTNKYNYSIFGTADEITAGLVKGDIDVAAVPCNLASVLYNKTEGEVVIAGINTLGVLYILQKNENIESVEDLKGKTILSTGEGTTPEYTLRYLLSENGIDPDKDVTIQFYSEASEVVSAAATMDSAVLMLPQPYVTVATNNDSSISVALDVTKEWEKLDEDSTVVTGVVVARKSFINEHPDQFNAFLDEYMLSADFANTNVDDCAQLLESFDIFKAAIAKTAIPACNVTFITGDEMKLKVMGYLTVLYNQNAKAVGGKLPAEDIFYTK